MYKGLIIQPFIVMKPIQSITIKDTIISLTDRNLIIIGNNGSGKTYVLDNIYSEIQKLVKDSDYLDKEIRIKRNNILKELENIYKNFIYILDLDKVELEKLKNNINSTSDIEFSIELKSLLQSINNKDNIYSEIQKLVKDSDYLDKEIRIKRNNILKELENIYKNFIYILDLDKVELEKLKNNINSTSDIEFSIELKSLLQSINNKHNIF